MTFSTTKQLTIACLGMMVYGMAQTPAPAAPAKPFKDEKEQTEAIAANNEKDPKAQLEKLELWKHDYPETAYEVEREGVYFAAYGALKDYHNQVIIAQQLRKGLPDNLDLLRTIFVDVQQIKPPAADDLAALSDAAQYVVDHADQVFDKSKKPANQTDAQWTDLKPQMVAFAQGQLDFVAETQGMDAVIARLKQDPTRVPLNGWLGEQYRAQVKTDPSKIALALFHYGRVAMYDGPNAVAPAARAGSKKYFDSQYKGYHGTMDGADQVLAIAKTNALPPDGFKIQSITEISLNDAAAQEAIRKANPMLAAWTDLKTLLTSDGGQAKFDSDIKESVLPPFKGKIISMSPANRPKTVVLAVEKPGVADCTLTFATPLAGKMEPGEELEFTGVAKSFTKEPYMLTLEVEKDKLTGWTGKNAPAARPAPKATKKGL